MQDPKSEVDNNSRVTWGDWDTETIHADCDNTPLGELKYWGFRAMSRFGLEGFAIFLSSQKIYTIKKKGKIIHEYRECSYHMVFDKTVTWATNVAVMAWLAMMMKQPSLKDYVLMQDIKKTATARYGKKVIWVNNKKIVKPVPKIVFRYGSQDCQIKKFLDTRKFVLDSLKKIA